MKELINFLKEEIKTSKQSRDADDMRSYYNGKINGLQDILIKLNEIQSRKSAEDLARKFHEIYERLAPSFGYETRPETREFNPESNNGKLMIAVCSEILKS